MEPPGNPSSAPRIYRTRPAPYRNVGSALRSLPWLLLTLLLTLAPVHAPRAQGAPGGGGWVDPNETRARAWLKAGNETESVWRGDLEFGYLGTTGNSRTLSTHSRLRLQNDRPNWTHTFRYELIYAEEADVTTTDQTHASQKSAFKLTADDYLFETVRFVRNPSQGYRYRFSEVVGYGRRVVRGEAVRVFLEAGPGARQTRLPDESWVREGQLYLSAEMDWDVTAQANFNWLVVVEATESNTITESVMALAAKLAERFNLKISQSVVHNSTVAPDAAATDTITAVTLVYVF